MEQLYLVEIFVDKVTIFESEDAAPNNDKKKLIIKIKYGPKTEFIVKEGQLSLNEKKNDVVEKDENGKTKWTRTIRTGKSYLFPSYPDTMLMTLSKFPLELEVWNDDEKEVEIFVGIGTMHWDTAFFHMLKETTNICKTHQPLSIKQSTPLFAECCCRQVGEISFILRLSALGDSIITEFQQLMAEPESFVFRTNRAPSMFRCKKIADDDPNFCMVGSLYETTTLEDPDVKGEKDDKIEICTEKQNCGADYVCDHETESEKDKLKKKYPNIEKIRMGDITGPCGNPNCALAQKVKQYLRNLPSYKEATVGLPESTKDNTTKKVCGSCVCKDDRWHRESCPAYDLSNKQTKPVCRPCGGVTYPGETCQDKKDNLYGTGLTPKVSKTHVGYIFNYNNVLNLKRYTKSETSVYSSDEQRNKYRDDRDLKILQFCCNLSESEHCTEDKTTDSKKSTAISDNYTNFFTYNLDARCSKPVTVYDCTEMLDTRDCSCNPPKPTPPCKTFDCDCIEETINIAARKHHKPYCPLYKHKSNCPVTMKMNEEEEKKKDEEEDEAEPLPYGLPPVQLGPCPVMGKPCTYPDGFARMYKNATLAVLPPSYDNAGKVCCSKEYARIKKALDDIMRNEKEHDFRCVNKFNIDTEKRCCDKEQVLLSLMGKSCCGAHKNAIQEKFKEGKS